MKDYTDDQANQLFGTQIHHFLKEAGAKLGVGLEVLTMNQIGLPGAMNDQCLYEEGFRENVKWIVKEVWYSDGDNGDIEGQ